MRGLGVVGRPDVGFQALREIGPDVGPDIAPDVGSDVGTFRPQRVS